ncbi:DUF3180 domain-containing protein [Agrococcus sp. SGAir0287]|uniref:DUF3180 domain-containing protein n=1 Tax=Agrococcus sp. SGAir0287 TaxID=2070347 RepID=UPI0010CD1C24|nr:DUF3180 domain-containing protein [Agrococcus sp. SGAir0287]QCR20152.1 DUF3180 domain-containing protein [Agrococcus sp. SGAir0287]
MSRTTPATLIATWLVAAAVGFAVDAALAAAGRPILPLPPTIGVVLAGIGVVLVVFAWPVRQMVRGGRKVGFRHATSVLAGAKASALVAGVVGGWASGALLFLLTRAVISGDAVTMSLVTMGGSIVLLVAALVAETWCMLPPEDDGATPA